MTDLRQTPNYSEYMRLLGWSVEKTSGGFAYIRKIPLLGYFVKIQRPKKIIPMKIIGDLRYKYAVFSVSFEAKDNRQFKYYLNHGFKTSKSPYLPSKTIHIDLRKTDIELLDLMHPKTRYNIGLARRRGVVVKKSRNIDDFIVLWQKSARNRGFYLSMRKEIESLFKPFGKNADLLFAYYKNKPVSAVFLVTAEKFTYYMYAASTHAGNKQFAPSLLVWESLLSARSRGSHNFDFEGIYDERFPLNTWKGFTRFKKGFGGKEIIYPGSLVKYFFPLLRKFYTFF